MATHDYVIDNSTGSNVRSDINNVLQAILTNNSSSSAPSTTAAYMWWADTTNGVLKIRNSSINDWVELLQLDGTLTLEDGSVSTPGLAFRDDLNTGIFSSAADTFNVATGGVERMELGATTIFNEDGADVDFRIESDSNANMFFLDAGNNRLTIGANSGSGTFNVTGAAGGNSVELTDGTNSTLRIAHYSSAVARIAAGSSQNLALGTGFAEKLRIDSSGRLLIGHSTVTPVDNDANNPIFQVEGTGGDDSRISIRHNSTTSGNAASIYLSRSKGTSTGSKTSVAENDALGNIIFLGADGTHDTRGAIIQASCDGTPSDNDMPSRLEFLTTPDGALNATEKMRITASGDVGIGSTPTEKLEINLGTDKIVQFTGGIGQVGNVAGMFAVNTAKSEIADFGVMGNTLKFASGTALGGAEAMRLDTNQRLLIGQTTTSATEASGKLCVSAAISGGGQGVITGNDTSSNDFGCGLVVNKASSTTTSSARFIQFYANNFGQPMGGIVGNGTENAQLATMSDKRYKKNIKPLSGILEKVNKLKTISFDWKHKDESVKAGFIAQNVQEIFPEYVVDNIGNDEQNKIMGTTGGMSAGYIAILTAAIQELSVKVAALEAA